MEKHELIAAILAGSEKMKEFGCTETGIYTIGVKSPIISHIGEVIATKYVTISRTLENGSSGIRIYCCEAGKDFIMPVNTLEEIDIAATWMIQTNCVPAKKEMRKLIIPRKVIEF